MSFAVTACTKPNIFGTLKNKVEDKVSEKMEDSEEMFSGSIKDFLGQGKNVKCTFSSKDEDVKMEALTYVSGDKVRSDTTVTSTDNEGTEMVTESHTILKDNYMYVWSDLMEKGMKMNLTDMEKMNEESDEPDTYGDYRDMINKDQIDQDFNYKCTPWIPDNSKFDIPIDIEFMDYTEMMNNMMKQVDNADTIDLNQVKESISTEDICAMCNMTQSETDKQTCRENLGCK